MRVFFQSLRKFIVDRKISFVIRFVYPQKKKYNRIKSIIPHGISLGDGIVLEENVSFSSELEKIGSHTYIGRNSYIGYCSSIGQYCSISYDVKIGLINHPKKFLSTSPVFYSTRRGWIEKNTFNLKKIALCEIGNDVLISANCMILAGVKIGDGAIIGAGALVNKDVPPYAIIVGLPGRIVGYRFNEKTIERLLQSKWWDLKDEVLKKHLHEINDPNSFLDSLENYKV